MLVSQGFAFSIDQSFPAAGSHARTYNSPPRMIGQLDKPANALFECSTSRDAVRTAPAGLPKKAHASPILPARRQCVVTSHPASVANVTRSSTLVTHCPIVARAGSPTTFPAPQLHVRSAHSRVSRGAAAPLGEVVAGHCMDLLVCEWCCRRRLSTSQQEPKTTGPSC